MRFGKYPMINISRETGIANEDAEVVSRMTVEPQGFAVKQVDSHPKIWLEFFLSWSHLG